MWWESGGVGGGGGNVLRAISCSSVFGNCSRRRLCKAEIDKAMDHSLIEHGNDKGEWVLGEWVLVHNKGSWDNSSARVLMTPPTVARRHRFGISS